MTVAGDVFRVLWDDELRVARVEWAPGSICGEHEARASRTMVEALGHEPVLLLVDMRGMAKFERPAREYYAATQDGITAMALLAGSPVNRMLANFFIGLRKAAGPMRMFTDEAAAVAWLEQQR